MLTSDSPTPAATKARYLAAEVNQIPVSAKLDGLPQRMLMNETLARLERAGSLSMAFRALANGWRFRAETGASVTALAKSAWAMTRDGGLTLSQAMMAANAPMIIKKAMVEGDPARGVLPSGQVAGLIDDLPSCAELVGGMVTDARQRIDCLMQAHSNDREGGQLHAI